MRFDAVPLALAFCAALFWAGSQVISSFVIDGIPTVVFIGLVEAWCIIVACLYISLRPSSFISVIRSARQTPKLLVYLVGYGVAIFVYEFSFYYALHDPNKLLPIVIASTWPLFTIIWVRVLLTWKPLSVRELILVLLAFSGAVLITGDRYGFSMLSANPNFIGMALLAAIFGGLWDPLASRTASDISDSMRRMQGPTEPSVSNQFELIAMILLVARLIVLPLYIFAIWKWGGLPNVPISPALIAITGTVAVLGYMIADIFFTVSFFRGKSANIVSMTYLVPMLAAVILWIAQGQTVSAITLIGLYLIFLGNFLLHTQAARLPPASAAAVIFVLIACGALIINPSSVSPLIGKDGLGPGLQLIMGVITLVLGFLVQQTDNRIREERTQFGNLLKAVAELGTDAPEQMTQTNIAATEESLRALRRNRRALATLRETGTEVTQSLTTLRALPRIKIAQVLFASDQWWTARQSVEDIRETWFLGIVVFAVAFSVVLNSVASRWLAVLSAGGASLLCYLWLFLVYATNDGNYSSGAGQTD